MNKYNPDAWVVVEITSPNHAPTRKVLAGWSGGYLDGDSWRLSSGITDTEETDKEWIFVNKSGSTYYCHKDAREFNMISSSIYNHYKEIASKNPDFTIQLIDFSRN